MDLITDVYISSSEYSSDISKKLLNSLEEKGISCSFGGRDFIPGVSIIENCRNAVKNTHVVVACITKAYMEWNWCLYEPALALDMRKHVILIIAEQTKLSKRQLNLFRSCKIISAEKKDFDEWLPGFFKHLEIFLYGTGQQFSQSVQWSLLKEFIWSVEDQIRGSTETAITVETVKLLDEINFLKQEKRALLEIRFDEISELRQENHELGDTLEKERAKNKILNQDRLRLQIENKFHQDREQTNRKQLDKLAERLINNLLEIQKIKEGVNCIQENVENLKHLHSATASSMELVSQVIFTLQSNSCGQNEDMSCITVPKEIVAFCQKYQNMVGLQIFKLGRQLGLNKVQMEKAEGKHAYGFCEMFWTVITEWASSANDSVVTIRTLLDTFEKIGIPIEGQPMSKEHIQILHKNMVFLQQNLLSINVIISDLLEQGILDVSGIPYVQSAKTRDLQIFRLVDIISLTDRGFLAFTKALVNSGQKFIADRLISFMDHQNEVRRPTEHDEGIKMDASDSGDIFGDHKFQVAAVKPTIHLEQIDQPQTEKTALEDDKKTIPKLRIKNRIFQFFSRLKTAMD